MNELDGSVAIVTGASRNIGRAIALELSSGGASVAVTTRAVHRAHVVAGKAGLDGLTKALAVELAPRGITVNLVSPGLIETRREGVEPSHRKGRVLLMGRRGRPEEVAAMARFLAGPDARYLTGQTIHVNGGAFMP